MSGRRERNSNNGREPLRVALVDEDAGLHHAVRSHFTGWEVGWHLDSYTDAADALNAIHAAPPQVVLMERNVQGQCGIDCTRQLKVGVPDLSVVLFTAQLEAGTLVSALQAGACGCLLKPLTPAELVPHLHKAVAGGTTFCPQGERLLLEGLRAFGCGKLGPALSPSEQKIMACLCRHGSNKEIGAALGISGATVHAHLAVIFKKLDVHDRSAAVRKFFADRLHREG